MYCIIKFKFNFKNSQNCFRLLKSMISSIQGLITNVYIHTFICTFTILSIFKLILEGFDVVT